MKREKIIKLYEKARLEDMKSDDFANEMYKIITDRKVCNLKGCCIIGNPSIGKIYHCENVYHLGKSIKGVPCQYYY